MRGQLVDAATTLVRALFPPDPGLLRLLAALRATLSGLLTFLLAMLLGAALPPHLAPSLAGRILGFAIGLFAGAAVRDPTGRQRALTFAVAPLGAFTACIAAALLLDHPIAAELLLPAIMFAVTYGGARGPRWGAIGTITLISYIISLVTQQPPSDLPAQAWSSASAWWIRRWSVSCCCPNGQPSSWHGCATRSATASPACSTGLPRRWALARGVRTPAMGYAGSWTGWAKRC